MINSRSLSELLPQVKWRAIEFIAACEVEFDCKMLVTSTFRDYEAQAELYAMGRRGKPGEHIVTNAHPGESWHNFRCAWDMVPLKDGEAQYNNDELINAIGRKAKDFNLVWGGDWNGNGVQDKADWDRVHFQFTGGLTMADLQAGKEIPYA